MTKREDLFLVFLRLEHEYGKDYLVEKMQTYLLRKECEAERMNYLSFVADSCKIKDCANCTSEYPKEQRNYCYIHCIINDEPTD